MNNTKFNKHDTPVTSLSTSYGNHQRQSNNNVNYQNPKASSREDSRRIARIHFKQLSQFLETHLKKEAPSSRTSARDKLTRLTRQQFQELSTDVYDELCRRIQDEDDGLDSRSSKTDSISNKPSTPYLPTKEEFHPKRNQARQKLATLPKTRFKDLASDVYYELIRRYPELLEEQQEQEFQSQLQQQQKEKENKFGNDDDDAENVNQLPSKFEIRNSSEKDEIDIHSDNDNETLQNNQSTNGNQILMSRNNGINGAQLDRNASLASTSSLPFTKATPRQSTVLQESNNVEDLPPPPPVNFNAHSHDHNSLRVDSIDGTDIRSSRSISYSSVGNSIPPGTQHNSFDVTNNSRQPSIADFDKHRQSDSDNEIDKNEEANISKEDQHKTQSSSFFNDGPIRDFSEDFGFNHEQFRNGPPIPPLVIAPKNNKNDKSILDESQHDIERLKLEYTQKETRLEKEKEELKSQVIKLIEEVKNLGEREEARFLAEERTRDYIHSLESQLRDMRDKLGIVKSEVDRFKRSSGLQPPLPDNSINNQATINVNEYGGIRFENLTGLQNAIDDLIVTGRSSSPSFVLNVMKPIVGYVTAIQTDVENWLNSNNDQNREENGRLNVLKERMIATLDNLMTATRNHAMGGGLSPISLLDAAASHVAVSAIEIAKLIGLKQSVNIKDINDDVLDNDGDSGMNANDDDDINEENDELTWSDSKPELEDQSNKVTAIIESILSSSRQHRGVQLPMLGDSLSTILSLTTSIMSICQKIKRVNDDDIHFRIETIVINLHNSKSKLSEYTGDEILEGDNRKILLSTLISVAANLRDLMKL